METGAIMVPQQTKIIRQEMVHKANLIIMTTVVQRRQLLEMLVQEPPLRLKIGAVTSQRPRLLSPLLRMEILTPTGPLGIMSWVSRNEIFS